MQPVICLVNAKDNLEKILISSFGIPKKKLQKPNLLPALKLKRLVALIKGRSLRSRLKLIDMATLF